MGLFDLLKSKAKSKDSQKIEIQQQALKSLAQRSRESGDYYNAFYFEHKAHIDFFEQEISFQLQKAKNLDDAGNVMQYLKTALSLFESMKQWCESIPGGADFFKQHIWLGNGKENRVDRLKRQIADAEYIYYTVVPEILRRAGEDGGTKQADLCHAFDVGRDQVLLEIRRLEMAGQVRTEKRGKYVYIIAK